MKFPYLSYAVNIKYSLFKIFLVTCSVLTALCARKTAFAPTMWNIPPEITQNLATFKYNIKRNVL